MARDIIIGIDAGTSMMKSIAFDHDGNQIDVASLPNRYQTGHDGSATQCMEQTWADCAATLRALGENIPDIANRVSAIAITGQGDGTWLVGKDDKPVGDAWLWLDSRASALANSLAAQETDRARFAMTGTGLNGCQQGVQLAHMSANTPELLEQAETAMHCKDWLYLKLTSQRATDPSEASFTFGDFKTRNYDTNVIRALGLEPQRRLLPEIVDGSQTTHGLSPEAATATGLLAGTPVSLGFVDVVCTAIGAGAYEQGKDVGCTIVGTTGMHMRARSVDEIDLNTNQRTGYVMVLPVPGYAAQIQTNMASTLNIDWVLKLAEEVLDEFGAGTDKAALLARLDNWIGKGEPASMLYHPYISDAGERGPFIDHNARAGLNGLLFSHGFADLVRAVVEGLGMAARDCYVTMGDTPAEIRLTGGAARSDALRGVFAATLGSSVRQSQRDEAGASGAAMMAAVATGVYPDMAACVQAWASPNLGPLEPPEESLTQKYQTMFEAYRAIRQATQPSWQTLSTMRGN